MNWFDYGIIHFMNSLAQLSWFIDATLVQIADNQLMVGGILMVMFWWAWMEFGNDSKGKRESLVVLLFGTGFSVFVTRAIAFSLPFRERPTGNPLLHFRLPFTANPASLIHWSSFPSDHATVEFCLAAGLWLVDRRLGKWAAGYAALISIFRIYVGDHYPTDILAGAAIGIAVAFLSRMASLRKAARIALNYLEPHPAALYALLFLITFEIGEMFDSLRRFGVLLVKAALRYTAWQLSVVGGPLLAAGLLAAVVLLKWSKRHSVTEGERKALSRS
jgi:undecaprenyl-diphosphatase